MWLELPVFLIFIFSLNDSPSKIIKNVTLFNHKSYFCSWDIQIYVIFSRMASDFCNENSRTIQEHFKNISILFNNISNVENIITIDLKVSFKKLNLIITKDKSHEIQISAGTKSWQSDRHKIISGTYIKASVSKRWIMKKMSRVFYETWKVKFKNISRTNP